MKLNNSLREQGFEVKNLSVRKRDRTKRWLRDARIHAQRQIKSHPVFWGFRVLMLTLMLSFMAVAQFKLGYVPFGLVLAFLAYCAFVIMRLYGKDFKKAQEVQEWAVTQNEHITMMSLTGKTQDELERLLQYHLDNGNLAEADHISQKLLAMVDPVHQFVEQPVEAEVKPGAASPAVAAIAAVPADPGFVLKTSQGLPNWLDESETQQSEAAEPGPKPGKKPLPDWLN